MGCGGVRIGLAAAAGGVKVGAAAAGGVSVGAAGAEDGTAGVRIGGVSASVPDDF
jgi:hypothetical protein